MSRWRSIRTRGRTPRASVIPFSRAGSRSIAVGVMTSSRTGSRCASLTDSIERCVQGSNRRIDSISSPQNSIRRGPDIPGEKRSRMPPRTENDPGSEHWSVARNPRSVRRATSASRSISSPTRSVSQSSRRTAGRNTLLRNAETGATQIPRRPRARWWRLPIRARCTSAEGE